MGEQEWPVTNLVLLGPTGNGKSSTGNTIVGQRYFKSKLREEDKDERCKMFRVAIQDGPIINVIDTPGLLDPYVSEDYISKQIINCLSMAPGGIHAVLFLLSVQRRQLEEPFNILQRIFGNKILDYVIIVFTGGDFLESENETLDDFIREYSPEFLTRILELCGGRKVLFDNRTSDEGQRTKQLNQLLAHVTDIRKQNGGIPYTEKMHCKIKHVKSKLKQCATTQEREMSDIEDTFQLNERQIMKMMVENALQNSAIVHEREMSQLKDTLLLEDTQNMNMMKQMIETALKESAMVHEIEMSQLKDTLLLKDTQNMNMVKQMIQTALKESAMVHEIEMSRLKDTLLLKDTQTMNMMENALKQSAMVHEKEMCQLKETLQLKATQTNMMAQMSAETYEREMRQLKDTIQQKDRQTMDMMEKMMENALKQSGMAHEREMHQLKDTFQQDIHMLQSPEKGKTCECNIM